jgi:hypothetical protein
MNRLIQLRKATRLFIVVVCFGFSPAVWAVSPPPDGGYPGDNTAEGDNALFNLTTGIDNTATGSDALLSNETGIGNTATGAFALSSNTTGSNDTATGSGALQSNFGSDNTANGSGALQNNSTGFENTATGSGALDANTTGIDNTATGAGALENNTTASNNTANGFAALAANKTGGDNTATGFEALVNNTTGSDNTANGELALEHNTTGHDNLADGTAALLSNTTGLSNIAVGSFAGSALTTGSNNIDIGAPGVAAEANTIRIGKGGIQKKTFIQGIRGATVASGVGVIVGTTGQLGTVQSSKRFKEAIKPMDKASEAILALKPVTFRYKKELDPEGIPQFGLVAEDVEKVDADLVARDADGKVNTVRYEAVNAMLLNEFLKEHKASIEEHCKVESLEKAMAEQQKENAAMRAMLKEQAAQIQKVSAQLELNRSMAQTVLNNQ